MGGITGLLLRRSHAQRGTLLILLVLVATVAGILAGTVGHTRASAVVAVRSSVAEAEPTAAALRIQTRLADDAQAQQMALEEALSDLVPGVELEVWHELRSETAAVVGVAGDDQDDTEEPEESSGEVRLHLADVAGLVADIVVEGEAPATGEVLLPAVTALTLGVGAGDEVSVGEERFAVSGTWTPVDPAALRWFGEYLGGDDPGAGAEGPVLFGSETFGEHVQAPFVLWTLTPVVDSLTQEGLATLAQGAELVHQGLRNDDDVAIRGLSVEGTLAETAIATSDATRAAAAAGLVPVALLAVICLIAVTQVARLLWETRSRELEILVARGGGPGRLVTAATLEAAVVTLAGAATGTTVAALVVAAGPSEGEQTPVIVAVGVAAALVCFVLASAVAAGQVHAVARRLASDRSGRARTATTGASVILVLAAAALTSWQLLEQASVGEAGSDGLDAIAVLSLGTLLAALSLLALALLGPLTRALAALTSRGRGLTGALAGWQVSRRLRAYAVPVVLLVLAAGSVTTAAGFAGATHLQREQVTALDVGAGARVELPRVASSRAADPQAAASAPYAALDGVADAMVVRLENGVIGQTPADLLAVDAGRAAEIMTFPAGLDLAAELSSLASAPSEILLDSADGTAEVDVRLRVTPGAESETHVESMRAELRERYLWVAFQEYGELLATIEDGAVPDYELLDPEIHAAVEARVDSEIELRRAETTELALDLWVADPDGGLSVVEVGTLQISAWRDDVGAGPEGASLTLPVTLPGSGPYTLEAVDVRAEQPPFGHRIELDVTELRLPGGSAVVPSDPWVIADGLTDGLTDTEATGGLGLVAEVIAQSGFEQSTSSATGLARLVPQAPPEALPVLATSQAAAATGLEAGSRVEFTAGARRLQVEVSGIVDAVPGAPGTTFLADQHALGRALLWERAEPGLPFTVFVSLEDPAQISESTRVALAEVAGAGARVRVIDSGGIDSTAPVREAFWIAAGGSVLLALAGVTAVGLALVRERRGEVMVLRALGQEPGSQGRLRAAELLGVGAWGAGLGILAGVVSTWLLVPALARSASTEPSSMSLGGRYDVLPALGLGALLAAGLALVASVVAARVRGQALDSSYREEVR